LRKSLLKKCSFKDSKRLVNSIFQTFKIVDKNKLEKTDLTDCLFQNCDLSNSVFIKCTLKEVSLAGSKLDGAIFERCNLEKSNLVGASIGGTRFDNCIIRNTKLELNEFIQFGVSKGFILK